MAMILLREEKAGLSGDLIKCNLSVRHSRRLTEITNNKIEDLEQYTVIKVNVNVVSPSQDTL